MEEQIISFVQRTRLANWQTKTRFDYWHSWRNIRYSSRSLQSWGYLSCSIVLRSPLFHHVVLPCPDDGEIEYFESISYPVALFIYLLVFNVFRSNHGRTELLWKTWTLPLLVLCIYRRHSLADFSLQHQYIYDHYQAWYQTFFLPITVNPDDQTTDTSELFAETVKEHDNTN